MYELLGLKIDVKLPKLGTAQSFLGGDGMAQPVARLPVLGSCWETVGRAGVEPELRIWTFL